MTVAQVRVGGPPSAEALQTLPTPEPQPSAMDRPIKRARLDHSNQAMDASSGREWRELRNVIEHNDSSEVSDAIQRRDWDEVGHLMERGQLSDEQRSQVVEEAGQSAKEEELTAFILPVLTEGERSRVLEMLFTRCLWPAVGKLLRQNISSTLSTQILSRALQCDNSCVFTTHVMHNCKLSQLDEFMTHLVATGQWHFVTNLLDIVSDENATWRVGDTHVDSRVLGLVAGGLWPSVGEVLRSGVSDSLRRWAIGVACERADDCAFMFILPHCAGNQLDVVLEKLVTRGLWMSVGTLLGHGVSPTQHRWALHEACQTAGDAEFELFIAPHCADDQLGDVLTTLVTRGLWYSVSSVLERGVSPTERSWAIHEACQHAGDEVVSECILPHCADDQLSDVLTTLVARSLWKSVNSVLYRGVSPTKHNWAVQKYCQYTENEVALRWVLPHCADSQLDVVLEKLVTRGLWMSVDTLLGHGVSPTQHRWALHEACQTAGDAEFELFIAPHCADDQLGDVLTTLVTRGLWNSVSSVLERGVSPTERSWAIHEACQLGEDEVVSECILPHCADDQLSDVLTTLVTRRLWKSVSRVLDRGVSPTKHIWAVHEVCQHARDEVVLEGILPHCADDQLDNVLTTLVARRLWKSVKQVLDRGVYLEKHSWAVKEACQHADDGDTLQYVVDEHAYYEEDTATILASRGLWKYVAGVLDIDVSTTKTIHFGVFVLHRLIRFGDWHMVMLLMGYIEDFHQHAFCAEEGDGDRRTPLEILIDTRQTKIIIHTFSRCLDLSRGVNSEGETTLHVACLTGSPGMLQELVGKRVDPRAVTVAGHSALSYAVMCRDRPQQTVAECIRLGFTTHQSHLANSCEAPGANMAHDNMGSEAPGANMAQDTMGSEAVGANMAQDTMGSEAPGANMAQDTMGSEAPGANMAQDTMGGEESHIENMSRPSDSETHRLEENHADSNVASRSENYTNSINANSSDCDDIQSINGGDTHSGENAANSMSTNSSDYNDMDSSISGFDDTHNIDSDDIHSMTSDAYDTMMSSPTLLAVMRGLPLVTQMLYESGACSYRELFRLQRFLRHLLHTDSAEAEELELEFYNTVSRVYEHADNFPAPDGEPDYMDVDIEEADPERVQECARYLQEAFLHPRSLKSTCRLVISHCLKLHDKREEDVGQLPLEPAMRRYVMFSDLTHADFGLQDDTAHRQTRDDFVRRHLSKHLSSTTDGSGCAVANDTETHLLTDGRQEVDENHTDDERQ